MKAVAGSAMSSQTQMETDPNVDVVSESRVGTVVLDGAEGFLFGFTASTIGQIFDLGSVDGDLSDLGPDGLAVDAETAAEREWTIGTTVPVTFASGDRDTRRTSDLRQRR